MINTVTKLNKKYQVHCLLGTCKSEIFVGIKSAATIRIQINLKSNHRDVRILLVPQTIVHDRSYSAICTCYINIKS